MKVYFFYILFFLVACGFKQNHNSTKTDSNFQAKCEDLELRIKLAETVFNDSTIVELYSKVKSSEIVVKQEEKSSQKLLVKLNDKSLEFIKLEDNESVNGAVDYSKFDNLFLMNGMCTKCETSTINIVSIYFGVGVELKVKKEECSWVILEKFIYDT